MIEIARNFGLGFNEIADANPGLDSFVPGKGVAVTVPTAWVLPEDAPVNGIVINLAEMRLYYFFSRIGLEMVCTYPIGIGSEGSGTPVGTFRIIEKIVNPSWHVPQEMRRQEAGLPRVVPPGPENPLGSHALRLSLATILIHGTNRPYGIGRRVSHGCIRLYPADIPKLFDVVSEGTRVDIVRQPVKVGMSAGRVVLEVHKDTRPDMNYFSEAERLLVKKAMVPKIDKAKMIRVLQSLRTYYHFPGVHTGRYRLDGNCRQVFLAVRELDVDRIPGPAQSWVNRHLPYMHGYGVVMTPAKQAGEQPFKWLLEGIPLHAVNGPAPEHPEIYYGIGTFNSYVISPNRGGEIDYPAETGLKTLNYQGSGGVPLSSLFSRLLFSYSFEDKNILFSARLSAAPEMSDPGGIVKLRLIHPLLIPDPHAEIMIAETRTVQHHGKQAAEIKVKAARTSGTYISTVSLQLPPAAPRGAYNFIARVQGGDITGLGETTFYLP